jgi:hypothetical protein
MTINGTVIQSGAATHYLYPGYLTTSSTPLILGPNADITDSYTAVYFRHYGAFDIPGMEVGAGLLIDIPSATGEAYATVQGDLIVHGTTGIAMYGAAAAVNTVDFNDYNATLERSLHVASQVIRVKMGNGTFFLNTLEISGHGLRVVGAVDSYLEMENSTIYVHRNWETTSTSPNWDAGNSTVIFCTEGNGADTIDSLGQPFHNLTINHYGDNMDMTIESDLLVEGLFTGASLEGNLDLATHNTNVTFEGGVEFYSGFSISPGTSNIIFNGPQTFTDENQITGAWVAKST